LAVTFCELSMGQRVFVQEGNDSATYRGLPIDLTKLRDREFSVLGRALSERWTDRFPSCHEFVAALKEAMRKLQRARRVAAAALPEGG
jgi:hypothetical protein